MISPSPASSVHSSDDEMVRALKRLRIDEVHARPSCIAIDTIPSHRLKNSTFVVPKQPVSEMTHEDMRKQKMMEMLQMQMSEYKQQYATMSQDPSITHCDG